MNITTLQYGVLSTELACVHFLQLSRVLPKEFACERKGTAIFGNKMKLVDGNRRVVDSLRIGDVLKGITVSSAQYFLQASFFHMRML